MRAPRFLPLGVGVWGDRRGRLHIDVPAVMQRFGMAERRPSMATRWIARQALRELRAEFPSILIVAHVKGFQTH